MIRVDIEPRCPWWAPSERGLVCYLLEEFENDPQRSGTPTSGKAHELVRKASATSSCACLPSPGEGQETLSDHQRRQRRDDLHSAVGTGMGVTRPYIPKGYILWNPDMNHSIYVRGSGLYNPFLCPRNMRLVPFPRIRCRWNGQAGDPPAAPDLGTVPGRPHRPFNASFTSSKPP